MPSTKRFCNEVEDEIYTYPPDYLTVPDKECESSRQMAELKSEIEDKIEYFYRQRSVKKQARANITRTVSELAKRCREYTSLRKEKQFKRLNQEFNIKLHSNLNRIGREMVKFDKEFELNKKFKFGRPVKVELSPEEVRVQIEEITKLQKAFCVNAYGGA